MVARVLVVDNDRNTRELVSLHLRNAGYEVDVAEDAIAAGYRILRARPDLIISQINLPPVHGFDLMRALRQDGSVSDIPVIFLTAQAAAESDGKELGPARCLAKPVTADTLLSIVAAHVDGGLIPIG